MPNYRRLAAGLAAVACLAVAGCSDDDPASTSSTTTTTLGASTTSTSTTSIGQSSEEIAATVDEAIDAAFALPRFTIDSAIAIDIDGDTQTSLTSGWIDIEAQMTDIAFVKPMVEGGSYILTSDGETLWVTPTVETSDRASIHPTTYLSTELQITDGPSQAETVLAGLHGLRGVESWEAASDPSSPMTGYRGTVTYGEMVAGAGDAADEFRANFAVEEDLPFEVFVEVDDDGVLRAMNLDTAASFTGVQVGYRLATTGLDVDYEAPTLPDVSLIVEGFEAEVKVAEILGIEPPA